MSAFEDYVNTELPRRPALLTYYITSYSGDPNDISAPAIVKNCPAGTFYLRDTDKALWRKKESTSGTWEVVGGGGGGYDVTDVKRSWSNITYYVDWSAGSDTTGDGSVGLPFKTITHALETLPTINMGGQWVVNVNAGTYAETIKIPKFIMAHDVYATNISASIPSALDAEGSITIQTTAWSTVTPATGPGSGTFTSGSGRALTLAGAGWTVNDLQYKFLHVISGGAWAGAYLPIESNTSDTIYLPYASGTLYTFEIVTTNVTIAAVSGSPNCCVGSAHNEGILTCVGLKFETAIAQGHAYNASKGSMKFVSCNFARAANGIKVNGGRLYMDRCIYGFALTKNIAIGVGDELSITNTLAYGTTGFIQSSAKTTTISYSVIRDQTTANGNFATCLVTDAASLNFNNNTITNCYRPLRINSVNNTSISSTSITSSTSNQAIEIDNYCNVVFASSSSIDTATDGFRLAGRNSTLILNGNVSNCTGIGVNMAPAPSSTTIPRPGSNFVDYSASNTMSGNGKDFSVDGSNGISKSSVHSALNATIIDLDYMNTVREH